MNTISIITTAEILGTLSTIIAGLLGTAITFVIKWLRSKGINIELDNTLVIIDKARQLVVQAEANPNLDGTQKLCFATTQLLAFCTQNNYKTNQDKIQKIINAIIQSHNNLNIAKSTNDLAKSTQSTPANTPK